eukprot:316127-Chlamydomonas_euryale.AAC.1
MPSPPPKTLPCFCLLSELPAHSSNHHRSPFAHSPPAHTSTLYCPPPSLVTCLLWMLPQRAGKESQGRERGSGGATAFPHCAGPSSDPSALSCCRSEPAKNPEDENAGLEVYLQCCEASSYSDRAHVDLLDQILGEPCYNQLRTKEQLG